MCIKSTRIKRTAILREREKKNVLISTLCIIEDITGEKCNSVGGLVLSGDCKTRWLISPISLKCKT